MESRFGELLRLYRRQTQDPQRGGALTQERLGELMGEYLGIPAYSGAAVSDWERGKSQIHKDERRVLVALIRVLYQFHGLLTLEEANTLLLAGNYRSLDAAEAGPIFDLLPPGSPPGKDRQWRVFILLLFQSLLDESRAPGPSQPPRPGWSGAFLGALGRFSDRWSGLRFLRLLAWLAIWGLAWVSTAPLLRWPFPPARVHQVVLAYIAGASLLPLFIGLLSTTRSDPFWLQQGLAASAPVRFYTHLGAGVGFQVGYLMVFAVLLPFYYLGWWRLPGWLVGLLLAWPLVLSAASAREVPFNQWRAYGRVKLADAWIFSVFFLFPLVWGLFLLMYHAWLLDRFWGPIIIVLAILAITWRERRKGRPA